jgi:hypothetical protein
MEDMLRAEEAAMTVLRRGGGGFAIGCAEPEKATDQFGEPRGSANPVPATEG